MGRVTVIREAPTMAVGGISTRSSLPSALSTSWPSSFPLTTASGPPMAMGLPCSSTASLAPTWNVTNRSLTSLPR